jgi:hypothetical protein
VKNNIFYNLLLITILVNIVCSLLFVFTYGNSSTLFFNLFIGVCFIHARNENRTKFQNKILLLLEILFLLLFLVSYFHFVIQLILK